MKLLPEQSLSGMEKEFIIAKGLHLDIKALNNHCFVQER